MLWSPRKRTDNESVASNKRILLLLSDSPLTPFVLSRSFSRRSPMLSTRETFIRARIVSRWLTVALTRAARVIDSLALAHECTSSTLIQIPKQACVCVYDVAGVTILLSQTVFSLLVAHVLTRTSEAVPLIGTDPPFLPTPSCSWSLARSMWGVFLDSKSIILQLILN